MQSRIVFAKPSDVSHILGFIRELAAYEKLEHEVTATEEMLHRALFGERRDAEVLLIEEEQKPVGFALFYSSFSTFLALPGIYLEDLYVQPHTRGKGYGKRLLAALANLALSRGCGRLEWAVLDWNKPAIDFYNSLDAKPMSGWTVNRLSGESLAALSKFSKDDVVKNPAT